MQLHNNVEQLMSVPVSWCHGSSESDKPNTFPWNQWQWIKVNGNNWRKRFLSQTSQWLEDQGLTGRRLHFTPLSKSSEQSSEAKETDSSWPLSWKSCSGHEPRNHCQKLRPGYGLTHDRLSLSEYHTATSVTMDVSYPRVLHILTNELAMTNEWNIR